MRPVRDGTGEIALLVPGGRDITERKERERRLEMKNDQLEEFAPVVSHDLKNPLMTASGNVEPTRETDDETLLADAEAALGRMEATVDGLLTLAKQGSVVEAPEPVRLASLVPTVETDTGTDVATDYPADAAVVADRKRFHSLFTTPSATPPSTAATSPSRSASRATPSTWPTTGWGFPSRTGRRSSSPDTPGPTTGRGSGSPSSTPLPRLTTGRSR